jgi:voltage-gated potassium channel
MKRRMTSEDNFAYLTVALILLLFVGAGLDQLALDVGNRIHEAVTVLTLSSGVWSIRSDRRLFYSGIGLAGAVAAIVLARLVLEAAGLRLAYLLIMLVYFLLTAWAAARQVLFSGPVDANKIVGAVCVYLLLGLIWAVLYMVTLHLSSDSFSGLSSGTSLRAMPDMVYFSFVTMTTLGYGDVVPQLPVARFLAYMEAVAGQFYVAVVVASLVSAYVARPRDRSSSETP